MTVTINTHDFLDMGAPVWGLDSLRGDLVIEIRMPVKAAREAFPVGTLIERQDGTGFFYARVKAVEEVFGGVDSGGLWIEPHPRLARVILHKPWLES